MSDFDIAIQLRRYVKPRPAWGFHLVKVQSHDDGPDTYRPTGTIGLFGDEAEGKQAMRKDREHGAFTYRTRFGIAREDLKHFIIGNILPLEWKESARAGDRNLIDQIVIWSSSPEQMHLTMSASRTQEAPDQVPNDFPE